MNEIDGPAFPFQHTRVDGAWVTATGMTLRDYFAAQALPRVLGHFFSVAEDPDWEISVAVATSCYNVADAMLKERAK